MDGKRKEFYVTSNIWKGGISCRSRTVLTYLSYCADRKGECFPSMRRIAMECGLSRNTARKAIIELMEAGLISCEPRLMTTLAGRRQTSNLYRILAPRGERKPAPEQVKPAPEQVKPAPEREAPEPDDGLAELLTRLDISGLYEDKAAARAVEMAIKELWHTESFRFRGEAIPRRLVRERLCELDIDAIDSVMDQLADSEEVTDKAAYLKACIYNAPLRTTSALAAQRASFTRLHGTGI